MRLIGFLGVPSHYRPRNHGSLLACPEKHPGNHQVFSRIKDMEFSQLLPWKEFSTPNAFDYPGSTVMPQSRAPFSCCLFVDYPHDATVCPPSQSKCILEIYNMWHTTCANDRPPTDVILSLLSTRAEWLERQFQGAILIFCELSQRLPDIAGPISAQLGRSQARGGVVRALDEEKRRQHALPQLVRL